MIGDELFNILNMFHDEFGFSQAELKGVFVVRPDGEDDHWITLVLRFFGFAHNYFFEKNKPRILCGYPSQSLIKIFNAGRITADNI